MLGKLFTSSKRSKYFDFKFLGYSFFGNVDGLKSVTRNGDFIDESDGFLMLMNVSPPNVDLRR